MSTSPTPQFLRKYQLLIKFPPSGGTQKVIELPDPNSDDAHQLRVTFDVFTSWWSAPWYADISIYNLNEYTANLLLSQGTNSGSAPAPNSAQQAVQIQQGMEVVLSAGYENNPGGYGIIWDGYVLQPLWERENQTDFKLTLHCINWLGLISANSVGMSFGAGANQQQIVEAIAKNSYHPIGVGQISPSLSAKKLPRGKVVFGNPGDILNQIARDNNMQYWLSHKGLLNFTGLADKALPISATPAKVFTPTTGIVGTPQQTQYGCDFRLLLDASVGVTVPAMTVKIDNTQIRQLLRQAGVYPGLLAQDGVYVVVGARYRGDTRGNDWYTDVTGWNTAAQAIAAQEAATGVQLGNG